MPKQRRPYSLRSTLIWAFSALTLPTVTLILSLSYWRNIESTKELLHDEEARAQASITRVVNAFLNSAISNLEVVASLSAQDPNFFRTSNSDVILHTALRHEKAVDHLYVTYEDGYMRGASRIDEEFRRHEPETPQDAVWHTHSIEAKTSTNKSLRHQSFYSDWPVPLRSLSGLTTIDGREFENYLGAKKAGALFISEPRTSTTSGKTVISLSVPIKQGERFIGTVSTNISVDNISHFLSINRVSPNSITAIINERGELIVRPILEHTTLETRPSLNTDPSVIKARIALALNSQEMKSTGNASFITSIDGDASNVSIFNIPSPNKVPWKVILITPLDDYVGPLRETARLLVNVMLLILPIELLLINGLSKRLASGFVEISKSIDEIRTMNFGDSSPTKKVSGVREINQIEDGFALLRSALRSFAQYIPLDVVRELARSGKPLALGVEKRPLAIFFCDLENFSTLAQKLSPEDLLNPLSDYFSTATKAISEEGGTVDKFIGDAVMAFWGAPSDIDKPALRACKAALKLSRRLNALNLEARQKGYPELRVRVGLNSAEALVGNIGSPERLSYTAVGDGVNVASRLEGINKEFGTSICLSDSILEEVAEDVVVRPLKPVSVKGRSGEFMIYELLGIRNTDDKDLRVLKETGPARVTA